MNESELYKSIKQELMHQRESVRYFNRAFFGVYLEWYRMWMEIACLKEKGDAAGAEELTKKRHVFFLENIMTSSFYQKNSGCYCQFLEIAAAEEKKIERFLERT